MSDIVERARIKSGMLKMGERIAFGSDAELIDEMAAEIERLRFELEQCRAEAVAMLDKAVMGQSRLRSLLKEAGDTVQRLYHYSRGCHEDEAVMEPSGSDWADAWEQSRSVLSKIKGEA